MSWICRNRIQEYALNQGITNWWEFKQKSGLPQTTAKRYWEDRDAIPRQDAMTRLVNLFDCEPGDLVYRVWFDD